MSYKKTVTFTANVADFTDGTVTARVQAENSILNQLIAWILANISGIQQLEKIEIGSSKWSGYPLYNVSSGAPSAVTTRVSSTWLLGSDCFILGKNKSNWTAGVMVDKHILKFSPTCSFEFQDWLNSIESKPLSIILSQLRFISAASNRRTYSGTIELFEFDTTAATLTLTLKFWKSSKNLIFAVNGKNDYIVFSNNENDANFGWFNVSSIVNNAMYSLNETMQANETTQTNTSAQASTGSQTENMALNYPTSCNPYVWGSMGQYNAAIYSSADENVSAPVVMHRLNDQRSDGLNTDATSNYVFFGNRLPNFPRIQSTQIYLRKVYTPNTATKAPVKLAYTPGCLVADTIYRVNNVDYLCLATGWASYLIEVEDQGD